MRASRLISVLLLLQTRGRMTAQQLADEFEVSVRTIYRDVDELSASGIPVFADRGTHGGFQLVEGYRTRLTGLTPEEAEALFLSGYPGPAAQLGLGTVLAAAQLKVLAALPPELRSRASRIRQRFHLDAPGWFQPTEAVAFLEQIAEAVWSDRSVEMSYRRESNDGPVVGRVVDPLGVVLKAGVWYMVGRSGDQMRTYRVSRLLELAFLPGRFERPAEFDLADYWDRSVAEYAGSLPSFVTTVQVRGEGLDRLADVVGSTRAADLIAAAGAPDENGWLSVTVILEDVWHAESQILRLGADARVIEPVELRDRVASAARRMAALYD
jgi:predicted DNA-binding transcriptional regulator YafY